MAKYSRIEVAIKMKETGIVPVFYHGDAGLCKQVIKACYDGGIRVFEFTNRGDFASLVFAEVNKWVLNECPGMIMGVGSILDAGTASMYIALGANFIVSPLIDEGMASVCNKRKILWSPGCGSVTEIGRAHELGAEVVKIFPGQQVGGPEFVKAVLDPCPGAASCPRAESHPMRKSHPMVQRRRPLRRNGFATFPSDILKNKDFNYIAAKCREALEIVRRIRS